MYTYLHICIYVIFLFMFSKIYTHTSSIRARTTKEPGPEVRNAYGPVAFWANPASDVETDHFGTALQPGCCHCGRSQETSHSPTDGPSSRIFAKPPCLVLFNLVSGWRSCQQKGCANQSRIASWQNHLQQAVCFRAVPSYPGHQAQTTILLTCAVCIVLVA